METPNEVPHQGIIANHHFAKASSECIGLYRDGHLLSAVMVSQAVAEGIWRFVLERNQIQPDQLVRASEADPERGFMARMMALCSLPRITEKLKVCDGKKIDRPAIAAVLVERKIISTECADAFGRIWRSFRNDVHHMNPKISTVNFPEVARRNMADLAAIERELFAVTFSADAPGKLVLVQPRYWDLQADGTTPGFLREPRIGPGVGASASGPTSGGA